MCVITSIVAGTTSAIAAIGSLASSTAAAAVAAGSTIASGVAAAGSAIGAGATALGTTMFGTTTASIISSSAIGGALSAGTSAAMGADGRQIALAGLTGAAMGGLGAGAGAAGAAASASAFGATTTTNTGAILGGVSGMVSGVSNSATTTSSLLQAKAEQDLLNQQAKLEESKSTLELENAEIEKMDQRRKARLTAGTGRAAAAANGVMLEADRDESLAQMWEQDVAMETAYDNAKIQHNAEIRAWGYRENARLMRYQGSQLVKGAKKNAITSTLVGFGTTALSAFGSTFAQGAAEGLGKTAEFGKTSDSLLMERAYGGVGYRPIV